MTSDFLGATFFRFLKMHILAYINQNISMKQKLNRNLTETETNNMWYKSSLVTFCSKEMGFCIHVLSVVDYLAIVGRLFW